MLGSSRPSTAPSGLTRKQELELLDVDRQSIVHISRDCTVELEEKTKERDSLGRLLADMKKKLLLIAAQSTKKEREVDKMHVRALDFERKCKVIETQNRAIDSELAGLTRENIRLDESVRAMREALNAANEMYEKEKAFVQNETSAMHECRRELGRERKMNSTLSSDLRYSRTANTLLESRVQEVQKKSMTIRSCVAETFTGRRFLV
eukprot:GEMP01041908.1.p1 GENE.GEMP01041908.1~~GEMP01041908.1.p1  ORF type:complete len:207 (+),score=53.56 GEMP01041908.1:93-713(+)